jgi:putative PEP-CTERM system TPR-repeat lipoprotein
MRIAEAQMALKNKDEALDSLRKAIALKADFVEAQRGLVAIYMDSGQPKQAASVARDIQKQRPNEAIGYLLEGDIHAAQKKWAEAAAAYRSGLAHGASTDLAIKLHMALVAAAGNEADRFAAAWLKDFPNASGFRVYLAQTATAAKDYRTAALHYRKVLESAPESVLALNNLAWVESQLKEPTAIKHAEKAYALAPDQPAIMDTLGVLLIDKGETARGVDLLQKATALAPQAASIRLNYAKALIKSGQKDAARKELDELAKRGDSFSGHQEVTQLRQQL